MKIPNELDANLEQYATEKQWQKIIAYHEHGGQRQAARALGINKSNIPKAYRAVLQNAAKQGYSPRHDMIHTVPDGFIVRGVSTYYGHDGQPRGQWVKSQTDMQYQAEKLVEWAEQRSEEFKPLPPIEPVYGNFDDVMNTVVVGDHHIGMLAWGEETGGENYNLKRAEQLLKASMQHNFGMMRPAKQACIMVLGDFLHYDGILAVTPTNRHILDSDSRLDEMIDLGLDCIEWSINLALQTHENVHVMIEPGNHDESILRVFRSTFVRLFRDNLRVTIDDTKRNTHVYKFHNNMIGTTHGHGAQMKPQNLPLIFATDYYDIWGETEHRYIHTGHVHHKNVMEFPGCQVETHGILAPADAYAANNGYRSKQRMEAITYHPQYGEYSRFTFNPGMM